MKKIGPLSLSVLLLLGAAAAGGKGKKKKPPPPTVQEALAGTLNEKRDDIQRCAIENALARGASRVDVTTRITINNRGQVVDSRITVSVAGGDGEQVRTCVDKVIRGITFPRSDSPLVNIERTWSVAAQ